MKIKRTIQLVPSMISPQLGMIMVKSKLGRLSERHYSSSNKLCRWNIKRLLLLSLKGAQNCTPFLEVKNQFVANKFIQSRARMHEDYRGREITGMEVYRLSHDFSWIMSKTTEGWIVNKNKFENWYYSHKITKLREKNPERWDLNENRNNDKDQ